MDKILVLYSNPEDADRLRLDKEDRALNQMIKAAQLPSDTLVRQHAATFGDLAKAVATDQYAVIHFSGHGSPQGFYLESDDDENGQLVHAGRVAQVIADNQSNIRLAVFMSCFSADAIHSLAEAAPYILTVFGPADDDAAITFVASFYEMFFQTRSIERAFIYAQWRTSEGLSAILTRRALIDGKTRTLHQVNPMGDHQSDLFLVDISQADRSIDALSVSREVFLSILSRKIRVHQRIFDVPRDRAILPIGPLFGIFSWRNASEVIVCHEVLQPRSDLSQEECDVWASVTLSYNDDAMLKYRLAQKPAAPENARNLENGIINLRGTLRYISQDEKVRRVLGDHIPRDYMFAQSVMAAYLDKADAKLAAGQYTDTVVNLECALSALHDLLNAATSAFVDGEWVP